MAKIDFTDAIGAATLRSSWPGTPVSDRFLNWVPDANPIGVEEIALADGAAHRWDFRDDYTASFEITGLTASQLEIALRLKLHLMDNGTATLATEDLLARTYTVKRAPGTIPTVTLTDEEMGEYSFAMVAKNAAAAVMRNTYRAPSS